MTKYPEMRNHKNRCIVGSVAISVVPLYKGVNELESSITRDGFATCDPAAPVQVPILLASSQITHQITHLAPLEDVDFRSSERLAEALVIFQVRWHVSKDLAKPFVTCGSYDGGKG